MKKKWQTEELTKLTSLFNSGKGIIEIAGELNRSYFSINKKLNELKLTYNKLWSEKEIELAKEMLEAGKNFKDIAEALNRSPMSVTKKMHNLGFKFYTTPINHTTKYEKMNWSDIQKYYTNSTYRGIQKEFELTSHAIQWAQNNNKLKLRTIQEASDKRILEGKYVKTKKVGMEAYRQSCRFKFSLNSYSNEFDFKLIQEYGWYKPSNRGNNLDGISRDHMYSVSDGFNSKVDPLIIAHPANCRLIRHIQNLSKNHRSCITLEELKTRIINWNKKYDKEKK